MELVRDIDGVIDGVRVTDAVSIALALDIELKVDSALTL